MENNEEEKIFVSSDYFFWFLIGVVVCFAVFGFFSLKVWQILLASVLIVLIIFVFDSGCKWLVVSCLVGFLFGLSRILLWGGEDFAIALPSVFLSFLEFIKQMFSSALVKLFPEPVAGFSQGIILGGQNIKFSNEFWQALKITSTAHLIAVSGYNITLIARGVANFLQWITLHRKLIWIFASLGVLVFIVFVGAPASSVRAGVISILMLVAQRFSRQNNTKIAFTFALALMSFLSPLALKNDLGLQLSFLASFGIFYLAPRLNVAGAFDASPKFLKNRRNLNREAKPNFFKQTAIETLSAQLMVFPLLLFKFGSLSIVGSLANLIVLPLIPFAMGLSFFSGLGTIIFEPLGRIIGFFSYPFLNFMIKTIEFFAGLPLAGMSGVYIPPLFLAGMYMLLFLWVFRVLKKDA